MKPEDAEEYTQALGQVVAGGWRQVALGERLGVPKALGLTTREWVEGRLGGYVRQGVTERASAAKELAAEGFHDHEIAEVLGVGESTVQRDLRASDDAEDHGEKPLDAIGAIVAQGLDAKAKAKAKARQREPDPVPGPVPPPSGKYRCIVIDPPWPMKKIERDERPHQGVALDYPVLSLDEIADESRVPVRTLADDDCHIYLWVTHKYLPAGLELLDAWGFRYQCVMTWRKNVGITPFSWMYDTEHVLFGRRGDQPLAQLGLRLSFDAPTVGHSVKPDVFYERVAAASPGPRVDMFARRERDGFVAWGNEVTDASV